MGKSNEHVGSLRISATQSVLESYSWIRNNISHRSGQSNYQSKIEIKLQRGVGGRAGATAHGGILVLGAAWDANTFVGSRLAIGSGPIDGQILGTPESVAKVYLNRGNKRKHKS